MKHNEAQVLRWIGLSEGGYINHKDDPGGATDRGITQATYDAWNRAHGRPAKPVRGISKAEAERIISAQYLTPVKFDDLPSGLDYAVADWSVNSGPARAVKELQKLVKVTPDGVMGAKTLAAVDARNTASLINAYCDRRMDFLLSLKTFNTFGKGWAQRVRQVRARALDMAGGGATVVAETAAPAPARASEDDRSASSWAKKAMEEPSVWVPVVGGIASGALDNDGPMQWVLAAVIGAGAIFAGAKLLKRGQRE